MRLPRHIDKNNLTPIGEGAQGRVYRIDSSRCIKIYKKEKYRRRELECLQRGAGDPLFPTVHEWGSEYLIREYIDGIPLIEYLRKHPLTEEISQQILSVFHTLERLQFRRLDVRLDHLIINKDARIRLIDPTNLMHMRESHPKRILAGLRSLGMDREFLQFVRKVEPKLADAWRADRFFRLSGPSLGGFI